MIGKKTICLNMIVKNEAHIILQTLQKLVKKINFDYFVISDTGSTDDTKQIIQEFFDKQGIPGDLLDHPWRDFAFNRTMALRGAYNKTDYLLVFDADDTLVGDLIFPDLTLDQYNLKFGDSLTYYRTALVNNRKRWIYKGVLHEYLECIEPVKPVKVIEGKYYIESGKSGDRSKNVNKYSDDAIVLTNAYEKEKDRDKSLAGRYCFYCAQSYRDCGNVDKSIEWYARVLTLNNWDQEKYYSCFMLGRLYKSKNDLHNAMVYYSKGNEYDPERVECVVELCELIRNLKYNSIVETLYTRYKNYNRRPEGKLFVSPELYDHIFEYHYLLSVCEVDLFKMNSYKCLKTVIHENIIHRQLYGNLLDIIHNYKICIEYDNDTLDLFYGIENMYHNCIVNNKKLNKNSNIIEILHLLYTKNVSLLTKSVIPKFTNKDPKDGIYVSIVVNKFGTLKNTINSVFNSFGDYNMIDYISLIINFQISKNDKAQLYKLYPWTSIKFVEEGSWTDLVYSEMSTLKPKYWVNLCSDIIFHKKQDYIKRSIEFLETNGSVKQVCFNRCFAETFEDYQFKNFTGSGDFLIHSHDKLASSPGYNTWPSFTLKPGITLVKTILNMGKITSELDYSTRFLKKDYHVAFFNCITYISSVPKECNHMLLHHYNLLQVHVVTDFKPSENHGVIKIINLPKRVDRKNKIIDLGLNNYSFVEGCVPDNLNQQHIKLFHKNTFSSRRGVMGCNLSHYNLWVNLLSDPDNDYYIIMEDDPVSIAPGMENKLNILHSTLMMKEFVFLAYHSKVDFSHYKETSMRSFNTSLYLSGLPCYSINKVGAKKLVDYSNKYGITKEIDKFILNCSKNNVLSISEVNPHLLSYKKPDEDTDSDVKNDKVVVDCVKEVGIPHVIYMSHKKLDNIKIHSQNWKKLNTQYEISLYADDDCKTFLTECYNKEYINLFDKIVDGPIKCDFWRLCILYHYGGVYCDADIEPLVPISKFIENDVDFAICNSKWVNMLNPQFIMCKKEEPILKECMNIYLSHYMKDYSYWDWSLSGIMNKAMNSIIPMENGRYISGIHVVKNKRYQIIDEVNNGSSSYCTYNGVRVFNNRYPFYSEEKHDFI